MEKRRYIWLLTIVLFVASCYKDKEQVETTFEPDKPGTEVESHITGFVSRLNDTPISDVDIQINSNDFNSDDNGYFTSDRIFIVQDQSFIKASKQGYFLSQIPLDALAGETHRFETILIGKEISSRLDATKSSIFKVNHVVDIDIPALELVHSESGQVFDGEYVASAQSLHQSELDTYQSKIPLARTSDFDADSRLILADQMYFIELTDADGVILQPKATLEITLKNVVEAPEAIFIQNQNGWYQEVTDYDYSNQQISFRSPIIGHVILGKSIPSQNATGEILTNSGFPLSHTNLKLTNGSEEILVPLSNNGKFRSWAPSDYDEIILEDHCGNIIHTEQINRLPNSNLEIKLNLGFDDYLYFTGSLNNCDDIIIKDGFIETEIDDKKVTAPIGKDGMFELFGMSCSTEPLEIQCFEAGSSDAIFKFDISSSGQSTGNIINVCPKEGVSEAIIRSDDIFLHYKKCLGQLYLENNEVKRMTFSVSTATHDEVHTFIKNDDVSAPYWSSPSKIDFGRISVISIPKEPIVHHFEFSGQDYTEIIFRDVIIQDDTGINDEAQFSYLFIR